MCAANCLWGYPSPPVRALVYIYASSFYRGLGGKGLADELNQVPNHLINGVISPHPDAG